MENYYETLSLAPTATPAEIKRAYFTQARKFPPERFPEEFKKLRAAYETLSDAEKRAAYEKESQAMSALPERAAALLTQAETAHRQGLPDQAETLLTTACALYPDLPVLREELANHYLYIDKTGKAIEIWDALCAEQPQNCDYAAQRAALYLKRGWRKKAVAEYERVLQMDRLFARGWVGLLTCCAMADQWREARRICAEAALAAPDMGKDAFSLYMVICSTMLQAQDERQAETYLQEAARTLRAHPDIPKDELTLLLAAALNTIMEEGQVHLFRHIREMAETAGRLGEPFDEMFGRASLVYDVTKLCDNGYSDVLRSLLARVDEGVDDIDDRCELASMEAHILSEPSLRADLTRLKKEFPRLYALHAQFFDEAATARFPQKLIDKRLKFLSKYDLTPKFLSDDEDDDWNGISPPDEPFRREEPKVGRNDPCPCGSGKKYKKCCGA